MPSKLQNQIETITGQKLRDIRPLGGGCIGEVYRVELVDQRTLVAKFSATPASHLDTEGYMLRHLAEHSTLPVPEVLHSADQLLLMTFIEGSSHFTTAAQRHAAELLAALHGVRGPRFGLERDTLIGGLHQPNPWTESWLDFFRDHRLLFMAGQAVRAGRLPPHFLNRLEKLCARLDAWLDEPEYPALLHGDVWTTNVLAVGARITGFIDPAVYYGHPEIELAFTTLFNTFDSAFFERYQAIRPIKPGFFEERRDLYNLYPLLVHVRLFGSGYVNSVDRILRTFGF